MDKLMIVIVIIGSCWFVYWFFIQTFLEYRRDQRRSLQKEQVKANSPSRVPSLDERIRRSRFDALSSDQKIRLLDLQLMPYSEYLKSPEWLATSRRIKEERNSRCELCGSPFSLETHHIRYYDEIGSILGRETNEDLQVLCSTCHSRAHGKSSPLDPVIEEPTIPAPPGVFVRVSALPSQQTRNAPQQKSGDKGRFPA